MLLPQVFERLIEKTPVSVMFRGILENALPAEEVDRLFFDNARHGYQRQLLFSQVVNLMGLVVARIQPKVHAAYEVCKRDMNARVDSVYDKLQRIEPEVSAALVRHVGGKLAAVIDSLPGGRLPALFPGHETRILDGKHLDGTQRRLKPLRQFRAVPLPGQLLVVLDAERMLACDVVPCEDAYAQERALVESILPAVHANEVWIEDRNFCTTRFMFGVADRKAYFLVRRHASTPHILQQSEWRAAGNTATGRVFQAFWQIGDGGQRKLELRAIRIELDRPTRHGDKEIVLLTNLPEAEASALSAADGYLRRWTIELALGEIATTLDAEINTFGYPKAALFCFCVALVAYNVLGTIKASLRVVHGAETVQTRVSAYLVANEIRFRYGGMELALEEHDWTSTFAALSPQQLGQRLVELAKSVRLDSFPKHPRGPKKKTPKTGFDRYRHLATARALAGQNPFRGKKPRKHNQHKNKC